MALNANALCTATVMREYLQQDRTAATSGRYDLESMEFLVNRVSSLVETYLGRVTVATTMTLTLDGDGSDTIALWSVGCYPVVSLTSITFLDTNVTVPARPAVGSVGYVLASPTSRAGIIPLDGYATPTARASVQVVGKFGFDSTVTGEPDAGYHRNALEDLRTAALSWGSLLFDQPSPVQNIQMAGMSMTFPEVGVPARVRDILAPYRRIGIW